MAHNMKQSLLTIAILVCFSLPAWAQTISMDQFVTTPYPSPGTCQSGDAFGSTASSCVIVSAAASPTGSADAFEGSWQSPGAAWTGLIGSNLSIINVENHNIGWVNTFLTSVTGCTENTGVPCTPTSTGCGTYTIPSGFQIGNATPGASLAGAYSISDNACNYMVLNYTTQTTSVVKVSVMEATCSGGTWALVLGTVSANTITTSTTNNTGISLSGIDALTNVLDYQSIVAGGTESVDSPFNTTGNWITNDHFASAACFPTGGTCDPPPTILWVAGAGGQPGAQNAIAFQCIASAGTGSSLSGVTMKGATAQ